MSDDKTTSGPVPSADKPVKSTYYVDQNGRLSTALQVSHDDVPGTDSENSDDDDDDDTADDDGSFVTVYNPRMEEQRLMSGFSIAGEHGLSTARESDRVTDLTSLLRQALPSLGYTMSKELDMSAASYGTGPTEVSCYLSRGSGSDLKMHIWIPGLRDDTRIDSRESFKSQTQLFGLTVFEDVDPDADTVQVEVGVIHFAKVIHQNGRTEYHPGLSSHRAVMSKNDAENLRQDLTGRADETWRDPVGRQSDDTLWGPPPNRGGPDST